MSSSTTPMPMPKTERKSLDELLRESRAGIPRGTPVTMRNIGYSAHVSGGSGSSTPVSANGSSPSPTEAGGPRQKPHGSSAKE